MKSQEQIYNYLSVGSLVLSILIVAVFFKIPTLSFESIIKISQPEKGNEKDLVQIDQAFLSEIDQEVNTIEFDTDNLLADLISDLER